MCLPNTCIPHSIIVTILLRYHRLRPLLDSMGTDESTLAVLMVCTTCTDSPAYLSLSLNIWVIATYHSTEWRSGAIMMTVNRFCLTLSISMGMRQREGIKQPSWPWSMCKHIHPQGRVVLRCQAEPQQAVGVANRSTFIFLHQV